MEKPRAATPQDTELKLLEAELSAELREIDRGRRNPVLADMPDQEADHVRQRDLARIVGLSLGMTNASIKRLRRNRPDLAAKLPLLHAEHACEIYGIRYLRDDASFEAARRGFSISKP
jgi:hypothetical protein